jgi:hypothetical protein
MNKLTLEIEQLEDGRYSLRAGGAYCHTGSTLDSILLRAKEIIEDADSQALKVSRRFSFNNPNQFCVSCNSLTNMVYKGHCQRCAVRDNIYGDMTELGGEV